MPKRTDVHKVLMIGSGPIVIGQAAEFDYAGTQACRALKEEGLEVVLVNSNPATIMTDKTMADKIYIEPLTVEVIQRIIDIEKPDSVLANMGGQTGLNIGMELSEGDFLTSRGIKLLGVNPDTIRKAEDRQAFKDTMLSIGEPCIPSRVVESVEDAIAFAHEIEYPVVVRPAYTLGGTGGGFVHSDEEMREICTGGLRASLIHQVLIEKSVAGWKEIEFEVIRDGAGNCIDVCSMENVDPVGVHTGDSIVVAPAQTLTAYEFRMMRAAALNIVSALGVEGGCNVQFALKPDSLEYAVIEVNPRVSRSSALASKATGYPIAKVACKIAIGYRLDEIINAVTGKTYACNEPAVDYCVIKFPKWPFDKFVYADRHLGTQMKATGEVMSIGPGFEIAFMKAIRSIELGIDTPNLPRVEEKNDQEIREIIGRMDDERIFAIYTALKRKIMTADEIFEMTRIDRWFLSKLNRLAAMEKVLTEETLTPEIYMQAKRLGFLDRTITALSHQSPPVKKSASYKMVDTCAAEFHAETPYFYSSWDEENEAELYNQELNSGKKRIIVFGSGPIRIGQGIEFDYCSVHCVRTLKKLGYEAIIANNNPETVSTDFDTSDRLYFDPLTPEDVDSVLETERPEAVVVQFGGQTAIKLTKHLEKRGVRILGTPADSIDAAEDRERFDALLEQCGIPRPKGDTVFTAAEALEVARRLGYPVLLRPSYVLGGQNMIIAYDDSDVTEYMAIITAQKLENPVLIDKYLMGCEVEVDAICDGDDYLIPGIMEHVERAGVHSGDSISVYPAQTLSQKVRDTIVTYTGRLARALKVVGLVNIQYVVYQDTVYVIEVNPRSSRTVPYISKVTNIPMVELATRCMLGETLKDMGFGTGLYPERDIVAVKVPVFSFEKLRDLDVQLGPEMKSTGEVLGLAKAFDEALLKGLAGAGYQMKKSGGVLITVRDSDKPEAMVIADRFAQMGFSLYATAGTANKLNREMIPASAVRKMHEEHPNIVDLLESGKIDYILSTDAHGRDPRLASVRMRRMAIERAIPVFTSIDTANAMLKCLAMKKTMADMELLDITGI
ncbi:MAG: carbamoyl-phosphate synthase large subunit [Clostridiales bacterium]|nr:carbamoyl-phosphate synthase large subunit [Clostridiales bacterium]